MTVRHREGAEKGTLGPLVTPKASFLIRSKVGRSSKMRKNSWTELPKRGRRQKKVNGGTAG